jgi:hypothetical protein
MLAGDAGGNDAHFDVVAMIRGVVASFGRSRVSLLLKSRAAAAPRLRRRLSHGYFAGQVATAAHLHEAIVRTEVDDDLADHTGRLLRIMADCGGMGMALGHYPPACTVLAAHAGHLSRQAPTVNRYIDAGLIANHLAGKPGMTRLHH